MSSVTSFFDETTFTATHVIAEPDGKHCAVVDPVLDYDPKSGRTKTESADAVLAHIAKNDLTVDWILETHAHADHLTAAQYLKKKLGCPVGIGSRIVTVQETFAKIFNTGADFSVDGSQFDRLFDDGEEFSIGSMTARVLYTPGHTPACATYIVGDAAFVGDTLFMPDYGTARCDFPGGDAVTLYRSIQKILSLPATTRLFLCHDYKAEGRDVFAWETTVQAERAESIHVHDGVEEAEFVRMRTEKDRTLEMPTLILPSIQVNMRAGNMPPAEDNGTVYLKIPVDLL